MGKIINILGPHGVGKTTLQQYIRQNNLAIVVEGYQFFAPESGFQSKEDYLQYQKRYLERINRDNGAIAKSSQNGFVIRSVEELIYFLKIVSPFSVTQAEIEHLVSSSIKSDLLVYLDASKETLDRRINEDVDRDMAETRFWYDKLYVGYDAYFKALPNIKLIKTDGKAPPAIYREILSFLEEKK